MSPVLERPAREEKAALTPRRRRSGHVDPRRDARVRAGGLVSIPARAATIVAAMAIRVERATEAELDLVRTIRRSVFVEEQAVPLEVEADGYDGVAEHFLARLGPLPVATARARRTPEGWKVERVAVLGPQRGAGVGSALIQHVLASAPPGALVYVHAQESALGFWRRAGFVAEGPSFEEGGLSHRWMRHAGSGPLNRAGDVGDPPSSGTR
jgi:predicted GNAT family N-acyltransferase